MVDKYSTKKPMQSYISQIYPELDNYSGFVHPHTKKTYSTLNEKQIIQIAEQSVNTLATLGIKQIIVSESGAIPFAKICAWIAHRKKLNFTWIAIKIPRTLGHNLESIFHYYYNSSLDDLLLPTKFNALPKSKSYDICTTTPYFTVGDLIPPSYFELEGLSLEDIIVTIMTPSEFNARKKILTMVKDSALSRIVQNPFIYFDEYIDSGKTLFQTIQFLYLFSKDLKFKIFSYMIKLQKNFLFNSFINTLFDLNTEYEAYEIGIYPFENRLDWIGYFYLSEPSYFKRTCICHLSQHKFDDFSDGSPEMLINTLYLYIKRFKLLDKVKQHCSISQVGQFISHHHTAQYSLYRLEELNFGRNEISEFLYQLFDMYGPIWSPMPDEFHFSYLDAFNKATYQLDMVLLDNNIKMLYTTFRFSWVTRIASLCEFRRKVFNNKILKLLEERYED